MHNAKVLEKQLGYGKLVTNNTVAAMVTNASRLVHNGLIGATIVASGVYFVIAVRDQVLKNNCIQEFQYENQRQFEANLARKLF